MNAKLHSEFIQVAESLVNRKIRERKIELVLLGGSVARGDEREYSDIDINFFVEGKTFSPQYSFYKFEGKYIEETIYSIKDLNNMIFPEEVKVLYGSEKYKQKIRLQIFTKKDFLKDFEKSKLILAEATKNFSNGNYEKTILNILGTKGILFQFIHDLPNLFNLPFPSFRLLNSVRESSQILKDKEVYSIILEIYEIKNYSKKKATLNLKKYSEIYRLFGRCYRTVNSNLKNFGFYEPLKIKFNIDGLKNTILEEPPENAMRFMINSSITWSLDSEEIWLSVKEEKLRKKIRKLTKEILDIDGFDKKFAEKKLKLAIELVRRVDKAIKK